MEKYRVLDLHKCQGECLCINNNPYEADLDCLMDFAKGLGIDQELYDEVGVRYHLWGWNDQERMKHFIPDTDPFKHGIHQAKVVATPFILAEDKNPFTKQEAKMLMIANTMHDFHEYLTGDVPMPEKTKQSDIAELELNLGVVQRILDLEDGHPFLDDYRAVMGDLEGWSRVGRAFHDIEICGYFLSGVRAWTLRHSAHLYSEEQAKCFEMGRIVSLSRLSDLKKSEFAYPHLLLDFYKGTIGEMQHEQSD